MGKLSRTKGANFEREMVRAFREVMPDDAENIRRGLQSRGGGREVADVECPVFHVECKRGKKPNPRAALKQSIRDARPGKIPIAIIRDDGDTSPFVALLLDDFLDFVGEWYERR